MLVNFHLFNYSTYLHYFISLNYFSILGILTISIISSILSLLTNSTALACPSRSSDLYCSQHAAM